MKTKLTMSYLHTGDATEHMGEVINQLDFSLLLLKGHAHCTAASTTPCLNQAILIISRCYRFKDEPFRKLVEVQA
jgi:hypothetical protein